MQLYGTTTLSERRHEPEQLRLQQALWWDGRPPHGGVHPVELGRQQGRTSSAKGLDGAERVNCWHALLQIHEGLRLHNAAGVAPT